MWESGSDVILKQAGQFLCNAQKLLSIICSNGNYILKNKAGENKTTYFVLKGLKQHQPEIYKHGYKLKVGIKLRFGRAHFVVIEISNTLATDKEIPTIIEKITDIQGECRICGSAEIKNDNPLISPCKCAGSVKFVHINCLKAWLKSKTTFEQRLETKTYTINKLECELCKVKLPRRFIYEDTEYDFIEFSQPKDNAYIILGTTYDTTQKIHIIPIQRNRPITIVT